MSKLSDRRREFLRMEAEYQRKQHINSGNMKRHRSADSLWADQSQRLSSSSTNGSRSSSPAPSSGLECGSMKDSPMQLVMDGAHDALSESGLSQDDKGFHHQQNHGHHQQKEAHHKSNEPRSVMSGGTVKGWLPGERCSNIL